MKQCSIKAVMMLSLFTTALPGTARVVEEEKEVVGVAWGETEGLDGREVCWQWIVPISIKAGARTKYSD